MNRVEAGSRPLNHFQPLPNYERAFVFSANNLRYLGHNSSEAERYIIIMTQASLSEKPFFLSTLLSSFVYNPF